MPSDHQDRRVRLRWLAAVIVYLLVAAWALCAGLRPRLGGLQVLLALATADAVTAWCVVDSQVLGRPILRTFYFLIFLAWLVAAPIYFVWSRKSFGLVLTVVHGLALTAVWLASARLPQVLAWQMAQRGWVAIDAGKTDHAVTLLSRAVEIEGRDPRSWYALGAAYEAKGRLASAAGAYRQALALDSRFRECREALYWCLCKTAYDAQMQGHHSQAAGMYREAIALDDTDPTAWHNLAISYEALGSRPAAVDAVQKAAALDPDNNDYRTYLEFLKSKPPLGETTPWNGSHKPGIKH